MAVVAALDLDDQVASRDRPYEVDGVHGRFGPGIDKAPEGKPPAVTELLGHDDGVLGRLGKVRPEPHAVAHRLDDGGVGVTGQPGAVATVHVDVLFPVHVVDLRTGSVAYPHGLGPRDLPARSDPTGKHTDRAPAHLQGPGLAVNEDLLLLSDNSF